MMSICDLVKALLKKKTVTPVARETTVPASATSALQGGQATSKPDEKIESIVVYAIEKLGLTCPKADTRKRNYRLHFEPFDSPKRFNEFDGIILFQGCFEEVERGHNHWGDRYCNVYCAKNELDKRLNETRLLLEKGGYICVILYNTPAFLDQ